MNVFARVMALLRREPLERERVYVAPRQAGVRVTEDTALTFAAVWACVNVISRTLASLPWGVYQKTPAGREPVDGTTAWLLNNQPNPEMTAFAFRETLLAHALLWGNGYAEILRDDANRPRALWPLTPDRVTPKRRADGELVYEVSGSEDTVELLPAQVLHVHGLGWDGLSGYSPVRMAARSLGLGMAQDVFGGAFYGNGAVLGLVAELPGNLNTEQIKAAEGYLNSQHAGPSNAFKVKVAPQGTKMHQVSMPMTDAQFLESRKFSVTEVARWFGVPPHKIADLERSTNNNIEHQSIEYVTDAIVPWATRLEQEANAKLIGPRAQGRVYTKLEVNGLMRGDSKARAEFYRTMVSIGAMSVNEVRALEELNGIGAAGDEHLVQINQTTLERLVEGPPEPAPEPAAEPAAEPDEPAEPAEPTNVIRSQALEWLRAQRKQA